MSSSLTVSPYSPSLDGDPAEKIFGTNSNTTNTMNSSIFGSTSGLSNYTTFGSGYGYGYTDATNKKLSKMTQEEAIEYQAEIAKKAMSANSEVQKASQSLNYQSNGVELQLQRQAQTLSGVIKDNKQDQVMPAYNQLTAAVKAQLKESGLTDEEIAKIPADQIKAYVENSYKETTGTSLQDDLRENSDSDFVAGLKNGALGFLGLTPHTTASKNIEKITGVKEENADKAANYVGAAAGGAVDGAIIGAGIGTLCGGMTVPGAIVGGIVGSVGGVLTNFFSKK